MFLILIKHVFGCCVILNCSIDRHFVWTSFSSPALRPLAQWRGTTLCTASQCERCRLVRFDLIAHPPSGASAHAECDVGHRQWNRFESIRIGRRRRAIMSTTDGASTRINAHGLDRGYTMRCDAIRYDAIRRNPTLTEESDADTTLAQGAGGTAAQQHGIPRMDGAWHRIPSSSMRAHLTTMTHNGLPVRSCDCYHQTADIDPSIHPSIAVH